MGNYALAHNLLALHTVSGKVLSGCYITAYPVVLVLPGVANRPTYALCSQSLGSTYSIRCQVLSGC